MLWALAPGPCRAESPVLIEARARFRENAFAAAATAFAKADSESSLAAQDRFIWAMALVSLRRLQDARTQLDSLHAAFPRTPLYLYWRGRVSFLEGDYPSAMRRFQATLEADPAFHRARLGLAEVEEATGATDAALRNYRQLRDAPATPAWPWPAIQEAELLLKLGRYEQAAEAVAAAFELAPEHPRVLLLRAKQFEAQGKLTEAIDAAERATQLDPRLTEAHFTLARLYRKQGNLAKAAAALERYRASSTANAH